MSIILFDGVCNLCNSFVGFVLPRNPSESLSFASLQSEAGRRLLREHGVPVTAEPASVVLIQDGRAYLRSDAAIRITRHLTGLWSAFAVFLLLPRPLRDFAYDFVAKRRYRWFGKQDQCLLPRAGYSRRFLQY